jgi:hypothetical protein
MRTRTVLIAIAGVAAVLAGAAGAADLEAVKTQTVKDLTVTVLSESGRWKPGTNAFVLAFTRDKQPVDVGRVTLNTSMPMPGMAPMVAGATLESDGPGRYRGTIRFPDSGDRQVTVTWDGPAGKGSTRFNVPVR